MGERYIAHCYDGVAEDFVFCTVEETNEMREKAGVDDGCFIEGVN